MESLLSTDGTQDWPSACLSEKAQSHHSQWLENMLMKFPPFLIESQGLQLESFGEDVEASSAALLHLESRAFGINA